MLTMTDLFCGAGGSSTGAMQVGGVHVRIAANHAKKAINTHAANHQDTDHDCADISQVDPRRYPRTNILWASPECTHHSKSSGKKRGHGDYSGGLFAADGTDETAIRSRATMWDVPRFAERHRYDIVIVENVPDVYWWAPEDAPPGITFQAWLGVMASLLYEHQIVFIDTMHAQALGPGSRSRRPRLFVVFWRKGARRPDFDKWLRPYGECPMHGRVQLTQAWKRTKVCSPERPWGAYGIKTGQYVYRCPRIECRNAVVEPAVRSAADAIDWTLPAQIIGARKRPLAADTMRRIEEGFARYARPILVPVEGRDGKTASPADVPLRTVTCRNETGLAIPPYMIEMRGGGSSHRDLMQPMSTVTAGGNHHMLVTPPLLVPYYSNSAAQTAAEPMGTVTTKDRYALVGGRAVASVDELGFRMVEPPEYAAAMEFPDTYVYVGEKPGRPPTKRQWVEMIGNAVPPVIARDLVAMAAEAITGEPLERAA